jgi:hypothetical protein
MGVAVCSITCLTLGPKTDRSRRATWKLIPPTVDPGGRTQLGGRLLQPGSWSRLAVDSTTTRRAARGIAATEVISISGRDLRLRFAKYYLAAQISSGDAADLIRSIGRGAPFTTTTQTSFVNAPLASGLETGAVFLEI